MVTLETYFEIGNLKNFLHVLETFLQKESENYPKEREEIDSYAKEHADELTDEEKMDLYDDLGDKYYYLEKIFPNILRNSFFLACYSFYEYNRSRLEKYSKKIDSSTEEELTYFKYIRNFITHHDGRLDGSKKAQKLRLYISNRSDISLDEHDTIILSKEFCRYSLDRIESFFLCRK